MRVVLRWFGYLVGGLLLLALLAAAWLWFASTQKLNAKVPGKPERLAAPTAAQLADGQRQLRILGCVSCHGEGLRGKTMFDEPNVATIHAPNLTLVAAEASDQQLARAIRQGIGADGRSLFVMPSAQYSRLDAALRALPKGGNLTPPIEMGPLGRVGIATGKFKSQPELVEEYAVKWPLDMGARHRRGWKIAATNCSECHGPALQGQELASGETAPDLTIAGAYDLPAFKRLMRTGIAPGERKLGLMREVAEDDFRHLTDEEIAAVHAYLVARSERLSR
jgi:mono/diheme cytochrome c family protein